MSVCPSLFFQEEFLRKFKNAMSKGFDPDVHLVKVCEREREREREREGEIERDSVCVWNWKWERECVSEWEWERLWLVEVDRLTGRKGKKDERELPNIYPSSHFYFSSFTEGRSCQSDNNVQERNKGHRETVRSIYVEEIRTWEPCYSLCRVRYYMWRHTGEKHTDTQSLEKYWLTDWLTKWLTDR